MYAWLLNPGSLSLAIQQQCRQFSVKVINQYIGQASAAEQDCLNIAENTSLIREVQLLADGEAWVEARTVIPNTTYKYYQTELDLLDDQALGPGFLCKHGFVRGAFEFAQMQPSIYTRRSIFFVNDFKMLVTEKFLPIHIFGF